MACYNSCVLVLRYVLLVILAYLHSMLFTPRLRIPQQVEYGGWSASF